MATARKHMQSADRPWSLGFELGHTAREASAPLSGSIRRAEQVYDLLRADMQDADQEMFVAVLLDAKHRPIKRVLVALGTLASVDVHPRECFREAIRAAACAMFVAHNHPSGSPEPSADDLALTARLRDVGRLVGIPVLDHVIISREEYVSLAERGML